MSSSYVSVQKNHTVPTLTTGKSSASLDLSGGFNLNFSSSSSSPPPGLEEEEEAAMRRLRALRQSSTDGATGRTDALEMDTTDADDVEVDNVEVDEVVDVNDVDDDGGGKEEDAVVEEAVTVAVEAEDGREVEAEDERDVKEEEEAVLSEIPG